MSKCSEKRGENQISVDAPTISDEVGEMDYDAYIGLDVHKDSIAISVAEHGRQPSQYLGEIVNRPSEVLKLLRRLDKQYPFRLFCYEAGPCGYHLYRQLRKSGEDVVVVAPSMIPKSPGVRIKTDRRDSQLLSSLLRAGQLTAVWVPDQATEAMRDLFRARDDMKIRERKARQQLSAWALRHAMAGRAVKNAGPRPTTAGCGS